MGNKIFSHIIIYLLSCILFIGGCREKDIERYENDPRLYFFYGQESDGFIQRDSVEHSFFLLPVDRLRDTVFLDVRIMGHIAAYDRPLRIIQKNAGMPGAAVAGLHYVPFDSVKSEWIIPANAVFKRIPIVFMRDVSLENEKVRLELGIEENDHFKPGINSRTRFVISTTMSAVMPENWSMWEPYLGKWGVVKMWFLVQYVGLSDFTALEDDMAYLFYRSLAIDLLKLYNENHPDDPLKEKNGEEVSFPLE